MIIIYSVSHSFACIYMRNIRFTFRHQGRWCNYVSEQCRMPYNSIFLVSETGLTCFLLRIWGTLYAILVPTHTSALFSSVLVQLRVRLATNNFQTDNCVLTCFRSSVLNALAVRQRENIVNYAHQNTGSEITRVCSRARTWATRDKRAFLRYVISHVRRYIHSHARTHKNKRAYVMRACRHAISLGIFLFRYTFDACEFICVVYFNTLHRRRFMLVK